MTYRQIPRSPHHNLKLHTLVYCYLGLAMIVLLISAHGGYYLQNAFVADAKAVSNAGVGIINKNPIITSTVPTVNQHEINLKLRYAHFLSIPTSIINNAHQVKVIVNYTASTFNSPILNKTINAIMKVYASNGTLIKISSFPKGFVATRFGSEQLATTIKDNKIQQLTAVVQFMTEDKLQPLSNAITVKLVFGQKIGSRL
jgi:hypothetical protein